MKQKVFSALTLITVMILLNSCTVYVPQPAPIPLFSEEKEFQASAGVTMFMGGTISAAYAPANHLGTQIYASVHPGNIAYAQGSIGFWNRSVSNVNFEAYGGFAVGKGFTDRESVDLSNLETQYKLYFTQFNIGQTDIGNANIDYGFGLKLGKIDANVEYLDNDFGIQNSKNGSFLIEPQAFIRLGGEQLKAGFQANSCTLFNSNPQDKNFFYIPFTMGISVCYRIAGKQKY